MKKQKECIAEIEDNIKTLKTYLETNIAEKESKPGYLQQVWQFYGSNSC